jgi:hypothetical protein
MNEGLRRRITALEQQLTTAPVILVMGDGSHRLIRGSGKHFAALCAAMDSDKENPLAHELRWLEDATEISGRSAEMFNLLAVLLRGPIDAEEDEEITQLLTEKTGDAHRAN